MNDIWVYCSRCQTIFEKSEGSRRGRLFCPHCGQRLTAAEMKKISCAVCGRQTLTVQDGCPWCRQEKKQQGLLLQKEGKVQPMIAAAGPAPVKTAGEYRPALHEHKWRYGGAVAQIHPDWGLPLFLTYQYSLDPVLFMQHKEAVEEFKKRKSEDERRNYVEKELYENVDGDLLRAVKGALFHLFDASVPLSEVCEVVGRYENQQAYADVLLETLNGILESRNSWIHVETLRITNPELVPVPLLQVGKTCEVIFEAAGHRRVRLVLSYDYREHVSMDGEQGQLLNRRLSEAARELMEEILADCLTEAQLRQRLADGTARCELTERLAELMPDRMGKRLEQMAEAEWDTLRIEEWRMMNA